MNKTELIDALAARYEGNRKAAAHALDSVLDTITREVARGEKVAITGFGSFERKLRQSRLVRNPATGEMIQTVAKSVPTFKPGSDLRDVVSGVKALPAAAVGAAAGAAAAVRDAATGGTKPAKQPATKKGSTAKKSTAKKTSAAKKSTAKKAPAKKTSTAKKSTTKKTSAAKKA